MIEHMSTLNANLLTKSGGFGHYTLEKWAPRFSTCCLFRSTLLMSPSRWANQIGIIYNLSAVNSGKRHTLRHTLKAAHSAKKKANVAKGSGKKHLSCITHTQNEYRHMNRREKWGAKQPQKCVKNYLKIPTDKQQQITIESVSPNKK